MDCFLPYFFYLYFNIAHKWCILLIVFSHAWLWEHLLSSILRLNHIVGHRLIDHNLQNFTCTGNEKKPRYDNILDHRVVVYSKAKFSYFVMITNFYKSHLMPIKSNKSIKYIHEYMPFLYPYEIICNQTKAITCTLQQNLIMKNIQSIHLIWHTYIKEINFQTHLHETFCWKLLKRQSVQITTI